MSESEISSCEKNDLEPFSTIKQSKRVSFLRVIPALLFVVSFLAFIFSLVTIVTNEYLTLSVKQNFEISHNTSSNATNSSSYTNERFVLIPQVDVSIGLNYVCVSGTCKSRHRTRGAHSFIPSPAMVNQTLRDANIVEGTEKAMELYDNVYEAFHFGDDIGLSCGTSTNTVRSMSLGGVATNVLHIIFIAVTLVLSIFIYFLIFTTRFLGQVVYIIPEKNCFLINGEVVATGYVLKGINAQIKYEHSFTLGMIASTAVAVVWAVVDLALSMNLFISKSKCGHSVCSTFKGAMDAFYDYVTDDLTQGSSTSIVYTTASKQNEFSCHYGVSFGTNIAYFVLTMLCFFLSILFIALYSKSSRGQRLRDVKAELTRIQKETSEKKTALALTNTPTALRSHEPSLYVESPNEIQQAPEPVTLATAADKRVSIALGDPMPKKEAEARIANPSFVAARQESFFEHYCKEEMNGYAKTNKRPQKLQVDDSQLNEANINKLGGRIAMLKQRKFLEVQEEKDREQIRLEEQKKFNLRRKQYNLSFRIRKLQEERSAE